MQRRYPPTRPKRRFRARFAVFVVLLVFMGSGTANYLRPIPALAGQAAPLNIEQSPDPVIAWPSYGQAAVGAQGFGLLAAHGPETPQSTASVAKIITCLAILEKRPLTLGRQGPSLTFTAEDVALYNAYAAKGGSLAPVSLGGQLTEYQTLQAILLPSGNNMADSAAIWTFGSLSGYTKYANEMLDRLDLNNTTVADDASGFSPNTQSTAKDLVKLGEIALKNPVIAEIIAQKEVTLPMTGTLRNVNPLLGQEGIIGIKTGNTDQAGGCFLFAATYAVAPNRSVTIVAALMGAPTRATVINDAIPFLKSARSNFSVVDVAKAGQAVGTYNVPWGQPVQVVSNEAISLVTWRGAAVSADVKLDSIAGNRQKNAQIGAIAATTGITTTSHPIVLKQTITQPSWNWRLFRNPFDSSRD